VLAGRDVFILADNDEAGRKKALAAANKLHGIASTIRIIRMPDGAKDVSEWLDDDPGRAGKFNEICVDTPVWNPDAETAVPKAAKVPDDGHEAAAAGHSEPRPEKFAEGVSIGDFFAFMEQHNYIFVPTRALWPAGSVNARVPPLPVIGRDGQPVIGKKWRTEDDCRQRLAGP
jgi:hypothetical protein